MHDDDNVTPLLAPPFGRPTEFHPDPDAVTHVLHGELAHTSAPNIAGVVVFCILCSAVILGASIVIAALLLR